ncbi:Zinc finger protein 862 [Frankliniella fusca]|uniref:Zinc finger protein 862 n=1 Tax=Frankliniella fusca TaxID=407009 RepID=A0AAE1LUN8_9NEOP|nr:Zinc finger protein 862 [Frankliniella fusca]
MKSLDRTAQPSLENFGHTKITDASKYADLKVAAFVAMHDTSVKSVDHLGELLRDLGKGSLLENVRLHRTKCSRLISAVIAPAFLTEFINDVGQMPLSLVIDEATDISVTKFICICIEYYSQSKGKMVSDFLGLIQVTDASGKGMALAVIEYCGKIGEPIKNCEAIGTDGASAMCGAINSIYTLLRREVPHLKLSNVFATQLINTNNWFAHSKFRKQNYEKYYETMNPNKKPKKLMALSTTRWLVWFPVSEIIFEQ